MKKILSVLLVSILLLTGCGKKENLKDVYKEAAKNLSEVNDIKLDLTTKFDMKGSDGTDVSMEPVKGSITVVGIKDIKTPKDLQMKMSLEMGLFVINQAMEMYFKDGMNYTNASDLKIKSEFDTEGSFKEFEEIIGNNTQKPLFESDDFINKLTMNKVDDEYFFEIKGKDLTEALKSLEQFSSAAGSIIPMETEDLDEMIFKFVVNKDKKFTAFMMSTDIKSEVQGMEMKIEAKFNFTYDNVKIDFPNFDDYVEQEKLDFGGDLDFGGF